jgi:hypothetical protein
VCIWAGFVCAHCRTASRTCAGSGEDGGGKSDVEELAKAPPHASPRRSALANAALYGTINGIVAVPAMVSFVAIIFQVRGRRAREPAAPEQSSKIWVLCLADCRSKRCMCDRFTTSVKAILHPSSYTV